MRSRWRYALLLVSPLACGPGPRAPLDPPHAAAIEDSVRQFAAAIAQDVSGGGPNAWLPHFVHGPEFFMASEGRLVFPSFDSATTFVHALSRTIPQIDLAWADIRVDPIAPGIAILGASYREALTPRTGRATRARGYFTGLAIHTASGWQLRDAHWSPDTSRSP